MRRSRLLVVSLPLLLLGCGGSAGSSGFDLDGGASSSGGPLGGGDGGGSFNGDGGGGDGGAGDGKTLLYAHTDKTLYTFDPDNLTAAPTRVGDFDCIGGSGNATAMTDLGVAKDGKLYGVSEVAAYPLTVQGGSVHCETRWPLPTNAHFYGLTVAPENTVAATEVLIAANGSGQLFQLDATSGTPTQVGTLGVDPNSGKPWALSGDIVFLANGGSPVGFATVRTCASTGTSCVTTDTLIEVNVAAIKPGTQSVLASVRGAVVKGTSCANASSPATFGSMYGVAAFHDKVYGFSRKGEVVAIDNSDGTGCLVASYPSMQFAGAGVTTIAPVTAPPVK